MPCFTLKSLLWNRKTGCGIRDYENEQEKLQALWEATYQCMTKTNKKINANNFNISVTALVC